MKKPENLINELYRAAGVPAGKSSDKSSLVSSSGSLFYSHRNFFSSEEYAGWSVSFILKGQQGNWEYFFILHYNKDGAEDSVSLFNERKFADFDDLKKQFISDCSKLESAVDDDLNNHPRTLSLVEKYIRDKR